MDRLEISNDNFATIIAANPHFGPGSQVPDYEIRASVIVSEHKGDLQK